MSDWLAWIAFGTLGCVVIVGVLGIAAINLYHLGWTKGFDACKRLDDLYIKRIAERPGDPNG